MQKQVAGKLMGVLVCSWTHARKLEFKVLSSQWETFQIFVAARWPLRSVCTQKTPDEQTGETDEQPARRGDVSINTQRENLVWKHIIKLKLNEPESKQLTLSIAAPFFWAYDPHSMKMRPSRFLLSHCTTTSVNASQPRSLWELAWCARTVSTALSNSTPGEQGQKKKRRRRAGLLQLSYCGTMIKHLTKWGFFLFCFFSSTLLGPSSQISMSRVLEAFDVRAQLFEHVLQAGNEKDLTQQHWFQLTHKFPTQGTSRYESYSFTEEERRNCMKKAIYMCFFPIRGSEGLQTWGEEALVSSHWSTIHELG